MHLFRFRQGFADAPESIGLRLVRSDGRVDRQPTLERIGQRLFQPLGGAGIVQVGVVNLDQHMPGRARLDRATRAGDVPQHEAQRLIGDHLEPLDTVTQLRLDQAQQRQRIGRGGDADPADRAGGNGGDQSQRRRRDDAQRPFRTDQQLLDVIAAIVFLQRIQPIEDAPVRQHRLHPLDQRAHRAVAQYLRAACVGGHQPADRRRSLGTQAKRKAPPHILRRIM